MAPYLDKMVFRILNCAPIHILWVSILMSEVGTAMIVSGMSLLFHGEIRQDFMATGVVTSLVVTLLVVSVMLHVMRMLQNRTNELQLSNATLREEVARRKTAEDTLHKSEERYRRISENMVDLICLHDPDARFIHVTPSVTPMLGYTPEELLGKRPIEFYHPDDAARFNPSYKKVAVGKQDDRLAYQIRAKDGHYVWLETLVKPILGIDGHVVHIQSVSRNITERVEAEQALRRERNFTRELIDSLPGMFYLIDQDGRFQLWNRKFEEITGYTPEEMAVAAPADFFQGEDCATITERVREVFTQGYAIAEANLVSKDGATTPYYFVGQRIELDGLPYLIGMGLDMTERKRMEASVLQSNEVVERAMRELRHSNSFLEELFNTTHL